MCKALGWVGVGVKPIRACLCLWSQRPSLLWCSPAGFVQCQSCGSEVTNLMVNLNKRADVALYKGLYNVLIDVRTIAGGDQRYCCAAASSPGYGAAWDAVQKDAAWLAQARSQGDTFFALCHEAGCRAGRGCEVFLDQLCSVAAASQSERIAYMTYALQRLHAAFPRSGHAYQLPPGSRLPRCPG